MYNAYLAHGGFAVTPSDTTELGPPIPTGLYVGSSGDVVLTTEDNSLLTYKQVPAGTTIWMRYHKVMAATTASLLIAQY